MNGKFSCRNIRISFSGLCVVYSVMCDSFLVSFLMQILVKNVYALSGISSYYCRKLSSSTIRFLFIFSVLTSTSTCYTFCFELFSFCL